MFKNYLTVALRNILTAKFYSIINVFGLMVGIASCLFIAIYINDELSYDRFNSKADRTYRIIEFILTEGSGERSSSAPFPVGETLAEDFPALIETQVRFFDFQSPTLLISERESKKEFSTGDGKTHSEREHSQATGSTRHSNYQLPHLFPN